MRDNIDVLALGLGLGMFGATARDVAVYGVDGLTLLFGALALTLIYLAGR